MTTATKHRERKTEPAIEDMHRAIIRTDGAPKVSRVTIEQV
jgi:hypothetical protein